MYSSPEDGMTWEQIAAIAWRESSPEAQAQYQQVMAATGQTWEEMCREAQAGFLARFAEAQRDPNHPFARYLLFRRFPYWQDP